MKKLFFFRAVFFFSASKIEWMNDMWTFPGKKTHTYKNTQKFGKKTQHLFVKKRGAPQNPIEWPMNFSLGKKHILFFFLTKITTLGKKTHDLYEWMNGLWTYPGGKQYGTFDYPFLYTRSYFWSLRFLRSHPHPPLKRRIHLWAMSHWYDLPCPFKR